MVKFSTGAEAVPELVTVAFEPGAPVVVSPTVTETLPLPAPFCPFRFGVVIDPFLSVMVSLYSVPVLLATETVGLTPSAPFAPCGPGVPSAEMPVSVSPVIQCFVALSIWGVMRAGRVCPAHLLHPAPLLASGGNAGILGAEKPVAVCPNVGCDAVPRGRERCVSGGFLPGNGRLEAKASPGRFAKQHFLTVLFTAALHIEKEALRIR